MNAGRTIFAQLMDHLPAYEFQKCVARYDGSYKFRGFSCGDQFLALAFTQLTYRESLRDIEACLRAVSGKLYHMGFRGKISRSTLADANEAHDWRIFADFAQVLIHLARPMYAQDAIGTTGALSDHTVVLESAQSARHYPAPLRRIRYHDAEHDLTLGFLTNNFDLPAITIALLYKARWQVELFFKWIKQHLRIKAFFGTSVNAVKTQIWIAISIYVLVAIIKKRLSLDPSLYQILQVLSLSLFEKKPILRAFDELTSEEKYERISNQLNLWGL